MNTSNRKTPDHLLKKGRAADPEFAPEELLFRRFNQDHFIDGLFTNIGLPFSRPPSVNREKYSAAAEVLFSATGEFEGWGVLAFAVFELPEPIAISDQEYTLTPRHMPLEENYAHSEIWCIRGGAEEHVDAPKTVKKFFRVQLSRRSRVVVPASK